MRASSTRRPLGEKREDPSPAIVGDDERARSALVAQPVDQRRDVVQHRDVTDQSNSRSRRGDAERVDTTPSIPLTPRFENVGAVRGGVHHSTSRTGIDEPDRRVALRDADSSSTTQRATDEFVQRVVVVDVRQPLTDVRRRLTPEPQVLAVRLRLVPRIRQPRRTFADESIGVRRRIPHPRSRSFATLHSRRRSWRIRDAGRPPRRTTTSGLTCSANSASRRSASKYATVPSAVASPTTAQFSDAAVLHHLCSRRRDPRRRARAGPRGRDVPGRARRATSTSPTHAREFAAATRRVVRRTRRSGGRAPRWRNSSVPVVARRHSRSARSRARWHGRRRRATPGSSKQSHHVAEELVLVDRLWRADAVEFRRSIGREDQ